MVLFLSDSAVELICDELGITPWDYFDLVSQAIMELYYYGGGIERPVEMQDPFIFILKVNMLFPGYMGCDGGSRRVMDLDDTLAFWADGQVSAERVWSRLYQPQELFAITKGVVEEHSSVYQAQFDSKEVWMRHLFVSIFGGVQVAVCVCVSSKVGCHVFLISPPYIFPPRKLQVPAQKKPQTFIHPPTRAHVFPSRHACTCTDWHVSLHFPPRIN